MLVDYLNKTFTITSVLGVVRVYDLLGCKISKTK